MYKIDDILEQEGIEACFNEKHGNLRAELVEMPSQLQWILVTLRTGPASTFLRRETLANGVECWGQRVQGHKIPTTAKADGRHSKTRP